MVVRCENSLINMLLTFDQGVLTSTEAKAFLTFPADLANASSLQSYPPIRQAPCSSSNQWKNLSLSVPS